MKSALLASLSLFLLLPSCGKSGGVTGTWVLDNSAMKKKFQQALAKNPGAKQGPMAKKFREQTLAFLDKMKISLVLNGDGTFAYVAGPKGGSGSSQKSGGTWKLEKDVLTLTPKAGSASGGRMVSLKFKYDGKVLVPVGAQGMEKEMVFRKQ